MQAMTTNPTKVTQERIERLVKSVRQELAAFQLSRFITEREFGIVDLDLFGLRFKFTTTTHQDDDHYRCVHIVKEDDINTEKFFMLLAEAGYLRWLRQQISTNSYLKILAYSDRWKAILAKALEKAIEQKKGKYLVGLIKDLQSKPFMQVYHEDPEIFDWLVK